MKGLNELKACRIYPQNVVCGSLKQKVVVRVNVVQSCLNSTLSLLIIVMMTQEAFVDSVDQVQTAQNVQSDL